MKKTLFTFIFSSIVIQCYSQNLLSPIWKYKNVNDFSELSVQEDDHWQSINLLLSWERQGHCGIDKNFVIKNDFFVGERGTNLQLEFSFAAEVNSIYVNQIQVVGKVLNSFWSDRDKKTIVAIPDSILKRKGKNEIEIMFNYLSYTGGVSHNFCSIHVADACYENSLLIDFPTDNHVYLANDKRKFTICSQNIANHTLQIRINNDFHETLVNEFVDIKKGKQEYVFDLTKRNFPPGIYECMVMNQGETYCGTVEWFAIQPEDISCSAKKFAGFDVFWKNALDELNTVEPNFKVNKVDSLCSSTRNGYVVEMNSLDNLTIRAYYFMPKTEGKHPVVLHVPGYSYGFEYLDGYINNESNVAELALCVRGHGISKDVFNPWDEKTLWAVGICNEEKYVYRAIFMDCVRAIDFLMNQTDIDHTKIGVDGGSQGGGLALATAGLCGSNIAACAVFDPWLCDVRHQADIRTIINKELISFAEYPSNDCDMNQMFSVLDFMDTKYFAADIKCPVYFSTSLFDDDCPPHVGFSVYNNIKTNKSYKVYPNDSHLGESEQYKDLYNMLVKMMLVKPDEDM